MRYLGNLLVVVATNNGKKRIEQFLSAQTHRHPIAIVDTGSRDTEAIQYLERLPRERPGVEVLQTPYRGYDTGAYLWAYWNLPFKNYLFLQDSMTPRVPDYAERMLTVANGWVAAWAGFNIGIWDGQEQLDSVMYMFRHVPGDLPEYGIFGPNFLASHDALDRLRERGLLPSVPTHKEAAQGCERGWAIAFHRAEIPVSIVVPEHEPRRTEMEQGKYPIFTKSFGGRA